MRENLPIEPQLNETHLQVQAEISPLHGRIVLAAPLNLGTTGSMISESGWSLHCMPNVQRLTSRLYHHLLPQESPTGGQSPPTTSSRKIPLRPSPVTPYATYTPLQVSLEQPVTSLENISFINQIHASNGQLPLPYTQSPHIAVGPLIVGREGGTLVANFYSELIPWTTENISWKNPPSGRRHKFVDRTPWLMSLMQREGDWHLSTSSMPVFQLLQKLLLRFWLRFSHLYLYSSHPQTY